MIYEHCAAWSFGKILKKDKIIPDSASQPGPGQYSPKMNLVKPKTKGFKMTGNERTYKKKDATNPGVAVGKYNIPNKFGNEGPKYSIKGIYGNKTHLQNNCSPGPGTYYPKMGKHGPFYSLGGRIDKTAENAKNPGVGEYNLRTSLVEPACKFGTEQKGSLANMNNTSHIPKFNEDPSAGDYLPNSNYVKPTAPKYSFGGKDRFEPNKTLSQGPGAYNFNPMFGNEGTSPTMGANTTSHIRSYSEKNSTPGPGAYNQTFYDKPNPKGFKMTGNEREYNNKKDGTDENNGVGLYNIPNKFGNEGPKYSMKGITGDKSHLKNNCSPGPGTYYPDLGKQGPFYSLGRRVEDQPDNLPGVGQYNIRTDKSLIEPACKFGTEQKGSLANMNNTSHIPKFNEDPSAGDYLPNSNYVKPTAPKYSFGGKDRFEPNKTLSQGPGAYNFNPMFGNEGTSPTMGANTTRNKISELESTPGPGAYNQTFYDKPNPKGFKMTGNEREYNNKKDGTDENNGVGLYNIPSKFGNEGPKFSMKGITGDKRHNKHSCSPGPGYYYPKLKRKGPSYSLGRRLEVQQEKTPGVGAYDVRTDKSLIEPTCKFGTEQKGSLANMNNTSHIPKFNEDPSAGDYLPNSNYVKPTAPKFSFGNKDRFEPNKTLSQGPGAYNFNPMFGNEGTAPTMKGNPSNRKGFKELDSTPGPGAYNQTFYDKPNAKGFKMGSSSRDMPNKAAELNNPAPGNYDYAGSLNKLLDKSPKWGMGDGNSTKMNPDIANRTYSPGPGLYDIREKIGEGGPKFSLGSKSNYPDTKWKEAVPGPGQYSGNTTDKNLNSNPKWKFGTEIKGNKNPGGFKNENPAPCQYNTCRNFNAPSTKFGKSKRMDSDRKVEGGPGSYRIPCAIVNVNPYTRESGKFDPKFKFV